MRIAAVAVLGLAALLVLLRRGTTDTNTVAERNGVPRFVQRGGVTNWWDEVPEDVVSASFHPVTHSNISRADYVGPEACRNCHQQQYAGWSKHPHRWMNALANETTVKGDFSGRAKISYRGGTARFYRQGRGYRMRLERDGIVRVYDVRQTIGSRFYQYYVGKEIEGPEPRGGEHDTVDHVLPFGYWLDRKEWVPTVHVHWADVDGKRVDEEDLPARKRPDPFAAAGSLPFTPYYRCNQCHTTFPVGDLLVRYPDVLGRHVPAGLNLNLPQYLAEAHPELWDGRRSASAASDEEIRQIATTMWKFEAPEHAVNLGISCEACHLGAKDHAERKLEKPFFFPRSRHLYVQGKHSTEEFGRTHNNVNWACGRCHAGNRRLLAGGMATWNSTEYTDAMRGSCYSKLRCVDCHNPHQATGSRWKQTPQQDDARCLKCHEKYEPAARRQEHTHHKTGSAGSRCLNCHMPHLNEGLQDVVRTHMIFSPTQRKMIEANQPNACNLCHTKQPIDWTLKHLKEWYGAYYSPTSIAHNYPHRSGSTALGWLNSDDQSVRLIAADALVRTNSRWALPRLLDALDDPYLLNRQFARKGIEEMLGIRLEEFGYRYYMSREERKQPLARIRKAVLKDRPVKSGDRASRRPP